MKGLARTLVAVWVAIIIAIGAAGWGIYELFFDKEPESEEPVENTEQ